MRTQISTRSLVRYLEGIGIPNQLHLKSFLISLLLFDMHFTDIKNFRYVISYIVCKTEHWISSLLFYNLYCILISLIFDINKVTIRLDIQNVYQTRIHVGRTNVISIWIMRSWLGWFVVHAILRCPALHAHEDATERSRQSLRKKTQPSSFSLLPALLLAYFS